MKIVSLKINLKWDPPLCWQKEYVLALQLFWSSAKRFGACWLDGLFLRLAHHWLRCDIRAILKCLFCSVWHSPVCLFICSPSIIWFSCRFNSFLSSSRSILYFDCCSFTEVDDVFPKGHKFIVRPLFIKMSLLLEAIVKVSTQIICLKINLSRKA